MDSRPTSVADREDCPPRANARVLYAGLVAANLAAWVVACLAFHDRPLLLGAALLAYGLGLRHGVDADHIAAIDNATRKLMQDRQRPVSVGLYFSLGHSTVVVIASMLIALAAASLPFDLHAYRYLGSVLGPAISATALFLLAGMNLVVLRSMYRAWARARRGQTGAYAQREALAARQGLLARLFRPVFRLVSRSWHMYPVGFLFGLGFDTATEVGLLGIAATQGAHRVSPWGIMILPALFSAGMTLVDTLDGHLMLRAYDWAHARPARRAWYSMIITAASVVVAMLVGGVEGLGLLERRLGLSGPIWDSIAGLNDHFEAIGYAIVAGFAVLWVVLIVLHRWKDARRSPRAHRLSAAEDWQRT